MVCGLLAFSATRAWDRYASDQFEGEDEESCGTVRITAARLHPGEERHNDSS